MFNINDKAVVINDKLYIKNLDDAVGFLVDIDKDKILTDNGIEKIYFKHPKFKESFAVFDFIKDILFLVSKSLHVKQAEEYKEALGECEDILDFITVNEENTAYTTLQAGDLKSMMNCIIEEIKNLNELTLLIPPKIKSFV